MCKCKKNHGNGKFDSEKLSLLKEAKSDTELYLEKINCKTLISF